VNQDEEVGVVPRLRGGLPRNSGSIPGRGKILSLIQIFQIAYGIQLISCPVVTMGAVPKDKDVGTCTWPYNLC
jgi:hypothetical protein